MSIEVHRSVWRAWLGAVLAIPMIFLAIEMVVTDFAATNNLIGFFEEAVDVDTRLEFGPPETREESGSLSHQGKSEAVTDTLWGVALFLVGAVVAYLSLREIALPRRILGADDEGLYLGIERARREYVFIPWTAIASVRSTVAEDDTGSVDALEVEVNAPTMVPDHPRGASWQGTKLLVDADGWKPPVHEVAGLLSFLHEHARTAVEEV